MRTRNRLFAITSLSFTPASSWRPGLACLLLLLVAGTEARAQTVSVWLTTEDQTKELHPESSVTFTPGNGGSNPVFVDETQPNFGSF